ncbi:MAG: ABC transporter ATP-binding protein [Thermoleophilia bacterium]|nr:ABC transporter ATP-binding protein [Thermoleophilia bacterium]
MNDTSYIATLEKVRKVYHMGEIVISALHELDLSIKRGEFLAVVGPSGSGKTTLLNLLGGIDTPSSGRITIDGEDISGFSQKELTYFRREKIGFIFQFFNLIPTLTARENVDFAIELASRDKVPPSRSAIELLGVVGLEQRLNHFPAQLSGGEQQRVAVARALAMDPALILGDEPTGNLDFSTGKLVLKAMKDLNVAEGKTCIIVTHNTPLAQVADRILHLHDGRIAEEEIVERPIPPEEITW